MRVLVTGAAGFIGSHLTKVILDDGHEVLAAVMPGETSSRLAHVEGRLTKENVDLSSWTAVKDMVSGFQPELCVHLAWYVVPGKFWESPENLDCIAMSMGLARALAAAGCRRLVGVGTCAEYDWDYPVLSEDSTPLHPRTLYGACKNSTRQMLEVYCSQAGIEFAWARYFFLFGPGEKPQRLVPAIIRAMLRGQSPRLNSGSQVRDFVHVQDLASATWEVAQSGLRGPVNIASGQSVQIRQIVETIGSLVGGVHRVEWGSIPDGPMDAPSLAADIRRLKEATHWQPRFSLEEGLQQTIDWWKGHLDEVG